MRRLPLCLLVVLGWAAVADAQYYVRTTRQQRDDRVPLLKVNTGNRTIYGTAVLIRVQDDKAWYLTNQHMTPTGSHGDYIIVTSDKQYRARYITSDASLDLAVLLAAKPPSMPLPLAARSPPNGALAGIHGWSHGNTFGFQEGRLGDQGNGWTTVSCGANQGQSGGPIIHRGEVVGLISRTTGTRTMGPSVSGIRRFLRW